MKCSFPFRHSIVVQVLALCGFTPLAPTFAQVPIQGDSLDIGGNSVGLTSGAVGGGNAAPNDTMSFLIGILNWIPNDGGASLGVGLANGLEGQGNVAFGFANYISDPSSYSGAFGMGHALANANQCFAFGSANMIDDAVDSAAIGHGLILNDSSHQQLVVGRYNLPDATGPLFVVGNGAGTAPGQQSNALVVHQNGSALLGGQPVITASTFPTYLGNASIALTSADNRSITINTSSSGAGKNLTIQAGNSANGTDLGGGLILSGGNATGGAGSTIEFRTAAADTSGMALRTAATRLKINVLGGIEAGEGLIADKAPQFVVGKFNNRAIDTTTTPQSDRTKGVFIIGTGETALSPKNAMRVLNDGTIVIQPGGDIDMGNFNEGERP